MKEAFIRFNNRTHKYETSTDGINYNDFSSYVSKERLIQYIKDMKNLGILTEYKFIFLEDIS